MLPISENTLPKFNTTPFAALRESESSFKNFRLLAIIVTSFFVLFCITLFLPWTQTVSAKGKISTFSAASRPQSIHSILGGRIEKWYVREGQQVKKGDTIAYISEVKVDYFDPRLVERTDLQVRAKEASAESYNRKITALDEQTVAISRAQRLKLEQTENKVKQNLLKVASDSIELANATVGYTIAQQQYDRQVLLYKQGLKSLVELEQRELKLQETLAKRVAQENKLFTTRNELLNARIDLDGIRTDYAEKLAKNRSDRSSAESNLFDAQGGISKLQTQAASYAIRAGMYHIIAPQDCYIMKLYKTGIGEIVKEGDELLIITPVAHDFTVDMYVSPIDAPLIVAGEPVRLIFDGYPAFVVSGWQAINTGTFGGRILAIDKLLNEDGKFRVIITPDENERPWPVDIKVGGGAQALAVLNNVQIWYELWRQFNGFPPDFYNGEDGVATEKVKLKTPIKRIK